MWGEWEWHGLDSQLTYESRAPSFKIKLSIYERCCTEAFIKLQQEQICIVCKMYRNVIVGYGFLNWDCTVNKAVKVPHSPMKPVQNCSQKRGEIRGSAACCEACKLDKNSRTSTLYTLTICRQIYIITSGNKLKYNIIHFL